MNSNWVVVVKIKVRLCLIFVGLMQSNKCAVPVTQVLVCARRAKAGAGRRWFGPFGVPIGLPHRLERARLRRAAKEA